MLKLGKQGRMTTRAIDIQTSTYFMQEWIQMYSTCQIFYRNTCVLSEHSSLLSGASYKELYFIYFSKLELKIQ